MALIAPIDAEGVGRKAILPKRAIGTPNAYYAKEVRDGITGILPEVLNARNLGRR